MIQQFMRYDSIKCMNLDISDKSNDPKFEIEFKNTSLIVSTTCHTS